MMPLPQDAGLVVLLLTVVSDVLVSEVLVALVVLVLVLVLDDSALVVEPVLLVGPSVVVGPPPLLLALALPLPLPLPSVPLEKPLAPGSSSPHAATSEAVIMTIAVTPRAREKLMSPFSSHPPQRSSKKP
jgi:hypothetical protein